MSALDIAAKQLVIDEGRKKFPYHCSAGKLTVGVGRNLEDRGLREDEIDLMLRNDILEAEQIAKELVPNYSQLNDERKAVLINMAFNLGKTRLAGFKNTLAAINTGKYVEAAKGMRTSLWYTQVGNRAERLALIMEGK